MNTISPSTSSMTTYIQTYNLCEYLRQNNFDASKAFRAPRLTYIHTYINALRTSGPISGTACYGLVEISLRWPTWKRFKSDLLLTQCSGSHAWALFNVCTQFIQQTKGTLGVAGTIRTIAAQAPHDDRSCGTWTIVACSCDFFSWHGWGVGLATIHRPPELIIHTRFGLHISMINVFVISVGQLIMPHSSDSLLTQRNACSHQISKPISWLETSQTRMPWLLPRLITCANKRNLHNLHTHLFLGSCNDTCWPHMHLESTDCW